jgi:hypothetical protein
LTELAILHSREIQVIEQRLELAAERRQYTESRWWVNWITVDPFALVQNILGGGEVGRDRLRVADLEVEAANLIRRREEVATAIAREVIDQVLGYEQLGRQGELLDSQIVTQRNQQAVMEASYRTGGGSTSAMLTVWQRTEDLEARSAEMAIARGRVVIELEQLIGAADDEGSNTSADFGGPGRGLVDVAGQR